MARSLVEMEKPEGTLVFYREIVPDELNTEAARIAGARAFMPRTGFRVPSARPLMDASSRLTVWPSRKAKKHPGPGAG